MSRLPVQPGERIDRSRSVTFTFDGKPVDAWAGDTIGSALFAAGQRVLSRSFKYHRPRGLYCCSGQCPNCLVEVDGAPGVRACTEPAREGIRVRHMNASPSLRFDMMRATDLVGGPFTPPGFYYKTFIRPRRLWPVYEKVLRHAAGLGRLRRSQLEREWRTDYRRRHADVLVLGAGPAGLCAAIRAAELGADVVLADEGAEPGGHLLVDGGHERARELAARARELGVEILLSGAALGFFDGIVPIWQGDTLHQVRAACHVAATGTIEQPLVFAGNDLPGVMLAGGARRLVALYALAPGRRAVVATTGDRGLQAALVLREAGVHVAAIADLRQDPAGEAVQRVRDAAIPLLPGASVVEAQGRTAVTGAVLARLDGDGRELEGTREHFTCDLLAISGGVVPASSLLSQAGARSVYDAGAGAFLPPAALPPRVFAAGEVTGRHDPQAIELSGALAGADAAHALSLGDTDSRARATDERGRLPGLGAGATSPAPAPPVAGAGRGKCFACLCEDVTSKDIAHAVAEGYDSVELAKRYTTVTMGPCQGRMCQLPSARLLARETGHELAAVGQTTARPPWSAVPLGALAGRPFEPDKRSALHARHERAGATIMWAGDWKRAYDYGDAAAEVRAVHEACGLIDVSSLGKLIVRGPDAGELLDRIYPNRFSNLEPGRVRYGVLSSDAGRIIDDGTICRLDDEAFYVTTTSSGAGATEEWFAWWLADWALRAHVTDVTQALAAVNLAGPHARKVIAGLTELDCSAEAFGYLDGQRAHVAGVPCLILRIGFVGELGYEIHCPAAHGEHVWDAILHAGGEHGIRPFGLEPQRVLRLQKMHILVGQDTDSESDPYAANMPWIVKLDKRQDFIGKWALTHAAQREPAARLVGFQLSDGVVPTEGAAVVVDGEAAGRVTSSRYSERLGHAIGMAWVPAALAADGASITIRDNGRELSAQLRTAPFYDPEGERQRS